MLKRTVRLVPVIAAIIGSLTAQSFGADAARVFKSAIFPGIGQLGDGGGEIGNVSTVKGLGFMAAEAICLSLTFGELTKSASYARETEYFKVKYHLASRYEDRLQMYDSWQSAFERSGKSKTMAMAYGGAAAAVWVLNLADVLVFAPKEGEQSMLGKVLDKTLVSVDANGANITFRTTF